MKKFISSFALVILFLIAACTQMQESKATGKVVIDPAYSYYGDTISAEGAVAASTLATLLKGKDSLNVKVKGTVIAVCQRKGCWMKLDASEGKELMVRFKNYNFFVPKDCTGKQIVMDGFVKYDTTSVEQLRHYAEDNGKSKEEIAQIMEPEISMNYEAKGVMIKND